MSLKTLARSASAFDGQVTFYMLPFHTLATDVAITELARHAPQFEYVNTRTGQKQTDTPRGWDDKQAQIEQLMLTSPEAAATATEQYEWQRTRLWRQTHDCYAIVLPLIVDIEFHSPTSPDVLIFQEYWHGRPSSDVRTDFGQFAQAVSIEMHTALWVAYGQTRDTKLAAPPVNAADPNAEGSGGNTATSTGAA